MKRRQHTVAWPEDRDLAVQHDDLGGQVYVLSHRSPAERPVQASARQRAGRNMNPPRLVESPFKCPLRPFSDQELNDAVSALSSAPNRGGA